MEKKHICEFCKIKKCKKKSGGWGYQLYCSAECRIAAGRGFTVKGGSWS